MSLLSLKIYLADSDALKTCQYMSDMYVQDVANDIRTKYNYGEAGLDHGLLFREQNLWLAPNKLLDHYDLKFGDTLEFRKRHRVLKVKMLDNSIKAVLIDESQPVNTVVAAVCERIGITNPDEYSFTFDNVETLSKKDKKKSKSIEQLYSEGRSWLNPDKTLREQGIVDGDIVILKKKFFYTDQNVDRNDPVQLSLMYNQAREMIVSGKHPCTADEAAQLGGIQMQILYGNYEPDKHKHGFIKLKDFVPPEYQKSKDVEKRIYYEHSKLQGLNELNARFRYVQMCRSLKSYGISFFMVREPATKKKKATNMLLGVTREHIVRMDIDTKETLVKWNLKQLRRWAATPKTFTLDFGEYSENYYTAETAEGEQISRLISGYIDIIIKRRTQAPARTEEQRMEEQAVMEDYVRPGRANAVSVMPAGGGLRQAKETQAGVGSMYYDENANPDRLKINRFKSGQPQGEIAQNLDVLEFQQAIVQTINNGLASTSAARNDLMAPAHLPAMSDDPASVRWRQETCDVTGEAIASHIAVTLAAIGALIVHATGNVDDMDYDTIGSKLFTIISSVGQVTQSAKMLAGLQKEESTQENILAVARGLNEAVGNVLRELQTIINGNIVMDNFYATTKQVSVASSSLLIAIDHLEMSESHQSELVKAAHDITLAVKLAVEYAERMASTIRDTELQNMAAADASLAKEIAYMLSAMTVTLAPTIHVPLCREQLMEGAVLMRDSAVALLAYSEQSSNAKVVTQLQDAVKQVEQGIARLIDMARNIDTSNDDDIDAFYDQFLVAHDGMLRTLNSPDELIADAKQVTIAATRLTEMLKNKAADLTDESERDKLISDAKLISDLTVRMVSAAKEAVTKPDDNDAQDALDQALLELKRSVDVVCAPFVTASTVRKLIMVLKSSMACVNQLISSSRTCAQSNRDQNSQMQLNRAAKAVVEVIPKIKHAVKGSTERPQDHVARSELIQSARALLTPSNDLLEAARIAAPTTADPSAQSQLNAAAVQYRGELDHLREILDFMEQISAAEELAGAEESLQAVQVQVRHAIETSKVVKTSETDTEMHNLSQAEIDAMQHGRIIRSTLTQMAKGVNATDERTVSSSTTEMIASLRILTAACIGIADQHENAEFREELLSATSKIGESVAELIGVARTALSDPNDKSGGNFDQLLHETDECVVKALSCLPSQRALDVAIGKVRATTGRIGTAEAVGASGSTFARNATEEEVQLRLLDSAMGLTAATSALVMASAANPGDLQDGASRVESMFANLTSASALFTRLQTGEAGMDGYLDSTTIASLSAVGTECDAFLVSLRQSSLDPDSPGLKGALLTAAHSISEKVDELLTHLAVSAPGYEQCTHALQFISQASSAVDDVALSSPVVEQRSVTFADTVNKVKQSEQTISDLLVVIQAHTTSKNAPKLADAMVKLAESVKVMTNDSVHAAQLIALADPASKPARPPVIDQRALALTVHEIKEACHRIVDKDTTQKSILEGAVLVTKKTAVISTWCKTAAQDQRLDGAAKKEFLRFAKETSVKSTQVMGAIKALASKRGDDGVAARGQCVEAAKQLSAALDELLEIAQSPDYSGSPAKFSAYAIEAQKPVLENVRMLLTQVRDVTFLSQTLCGNMENDEMRTKLVADTTKLSETVTGMATCVEQAGPGQKECQATIDRLKETTDVLEATLSQMSTGATVTESLHAAATTSTKTPGASTIIAQMLVTQSNATGASSDTTESAALQDAIQVLSSLADVVGRSSRQDVIQLTSSIDEIPVMFGRVTNMVVSLASSVEDADLQKQLLESARGLSTALVTYIAVVKSDSINPTEFSAIEIESEKTVLKTVLADICLVVDEVAGRNGAKAAEAAAAEGKARTEKISSAFESSNETIRVALTSMETKPVGVDETERAFQFIASDIEAAGKHMVEVMGVALARGAKVDGYAPACDKVSTAYIDVAKFAMQAAGTTEDEALRKRLLDLAREVGGATIKVIDATRNAAVKAAASATADGAPGAVDASSRLKVSQATREMATKLAELNAVASEGAKGLVACQTVLDQIDDIIAEFETSFIFAQARQLDPLDTKDRFTNHKASLLKSAHDISVSVEPLGHANSATQEELVFMATEAVKAAYTFKETALKSVTAISSADSANQLKLLTLGKVISSSLQLLVKAAGNSSGMPDYSRAVAEIHEWSRQLHESIANLEEFVAHYGDDEQRLLSAIESTIDGIQAASELMSDANAPALGTALPEEVMAIARQLAGTAAAVVANSNPSSTSSMLMTPASATITAPSPSAEDTVSPATSSTAASIVEMVGTVSNVVGGVVGGVVSGVVGNVGSVVSGVVNTVVGTPVQASRVEALIQVLAEFRKIVDDLVRTSKAATAKAPEASRSEMVDAVARVTVSCKFLVLSVKAIHEIGTPDTRQQMQSVAKDVTVAVTGVMNAASHLVPDGYVNPNDPNVVAERELLTAASAIEAAAKRLAALRPAEGPREANMELNFEEQIFEAAKAIAAATSALVRSATTAQREILAHGRTGPKSDTVYFSDGTWSDGLVSAAKLVATATSDLCESANEAVKGNMQRERVIVCAKAVSASTVQLLTAAAVRSDSMSQAQIRLRSAGKAVTDAAEQLVEAAKISGDDDDGNEDESATGNTSASATRSKVLEMEAQMNILRMEKELERARSTLATVRKGRYTGTTANSTSPSSSGAPLVSPSGSQGHSVGSKRLSVDRSNPTQSAGGFTIGSKPRSVAAPSSLASTRVDFGPRKVRAANTRQSPSPTQGPQAQSDSFANASATKQSESTSNQA